jgi:hypothetical protein
MKKVIASGVAAVFAASWIAVHDAAAQGMPTNAGQGGDCNAPAAAMIGGIFGAMAGGKDNRAAGAAIGAAISALACAAYNYSSEQTKTSEQVRQELQAKNVQLSEQPALADYTPRIAPGTTVARGSKVSFRSDIEIAPGRNGAAVEAKERLVLFDEKGQHVTTKERVVNEATRQAGRYASEFQITFPEGIPQGVYPVKRQVLLNNQVVKEVSANLQLI